MTDSITLTAWQQSLVEVHKEERGLEIGPEVAFELHRFAGDAFVPPTTIAERIAMRHAFRRHLIAQTLRSLDPMALVTWSKYVKSGSSLPIPLNLVPIEQARLNAALQLFECTQTVVDLATHLDRDIVLPLHSALAETAEGRRSEALSSFAQNLAAMGGEKYVAFSQSALLSSGHRMSITSHALSMHPEASDGDVVLGSTIKHRLGTRLARLGGKLELLIHDIGALFTDSPTDGAAFCGKTIARIGEWHNNYEDLAFALFQERFAVLHDEVARRLIAPLRETRGLSASLAAKWNELRPVGEELEHDFDDLRTDIITWFDEYAERNKNLMTPDRISSLTGKLHRIMIRLQVAINPFHILQHCPRKDLANNVQEFISSWVAVQEDIDRARIDTILMFLIDNAHAFPRNDYPEGEEFRVMMAAVPGEYISVSDNGQGMTPARLAEVREAIRTGTPLKKSYHGGSRRRLIDVAYHARKLGGTLEIQSTYGVGSTFTVRFPGMR